MAKFTVSQLDSKPDGYDILDTDLLLLTIGTDTPFLSSVKISTQQYAAYIAGAPIGWVDDGTVVTLSTSTDKVGIGTTAPQNKLHIATGDSTNDNYRTGTDTPLIVEAPDGGASYIQMVANNNEAKGLIMGTTTDTAAGALIYDEDGGGMRVKSGGLDRLWIDTAGNVGIGAVPSTALHVKTATPTIRSEHTDGDYLQLLHNGSAGYIDTKNEDLIFRMGAAGTTEAMRIDSSGNVGIGTTAPGTLLELEGSGSSLLTLNSTSSYTAIEFEENGTARFRILTNDGSSGIRFYDTGASAERMRIVASGNVGIGTVPNANALLDVSSTTKAFMPPRMTTTQRDAVASPAAGMVVYNTTTNVLNFHNGSAWGAV